MYKSITGITQLHHHVFNKSIRNLKRIDIIRPAYLNIKLIAKFIVNFGIAHRRYRDLWGMVILNLLNHVGVQY